MRFVRKSLLVLITPLFLVLLYTTAIDVGFAHIGTHPATIKHILADSGIYKTVVPGLLDQSKQISGGGGDVNLNDPLIRSAAATTFSPQFVQQNSEAVLDGTYNWLDGKTPIPDFQIDLTSSKTAFANNVSQLIQQRLAGLPVCTTTAQVENFDPLTAACLPSGVSATSAGSTLQSNILTGKGFLDNPVITADSIKNGKDNQPLFTGKLKSAPDKYRMAKATPLILGALTVLVALAIVFLSSGRAAGLRRIGFPLLIIGLLLLVFAWAINRVTSQTLAPKISVNNAVLQSSLRTLLVDVEQAVDKSYWWFGGGYVVLGAAAMGGSMYLKRGGQKNHLAVTAGESAEPPDPDEHSSGSADGPKTPASPKTRRSIKVQ